MSDPDDRLRRARLSAQGLARPRAATPEEVVRGLLAVQAQDLRGARLAIRARSTGLTSAHVDEALTVRRSLVVGWLNRGTLHLVAAEDYWWLHGLTAARSEVANTRRLRQEGVSEVQAARGVEVVAEAVRSRGPRTRAQLKDELDDAGVPTERQALVHVLFAASIVGYLVRGPIVDGEQAFVDATSWIGAPEALDPVESLARLARRYLAGHGPASDRDLARWTGLSLGAARAAFASLGDEVRPWDDGLSRLASGPSAGSLPPPRLLGAFDPILHGWSSRAVFVGDHHSIVTSNGVFRPTALIDGRTAATWTLDHRGVILRPLEAMSASTMDALEQDARAVQRYLGRPETGIVAVEPAGRH